MHAGAERIAAATAPKDEPAAPVHALEAALEAAEVRLVDQVEEQDVGDRRVAAQRLDERRVDLRLARLGRHRRVLLRPVEGAQRRAGRDLPADLVEHETGDRTDRLRRLLEHGLPRAGEGVVERLLDPPEVVRAGLRPLVAGGVVLGRGVLRIQVEREVVHQRLRPPALAVRASERGEETDRRGRGHVVGLGREREPDHVDVGIDALERVVRLGEGRARDGGGHVLPARELGREEVRLVGLVQDDEAPHRGVRARNPRGVGGEVARRVGLERARVHRHELEDELDAGPLRRRDEPVEEPALLDHVRLGLVEAHRHPVDAQADSVEVGEELLRRRRPRTSARPPPLRTSALWLEASSAKPTTPGRSTGAPQEPLARRARGRLGGRLEPHDPERRQRHLGGERLVVPGLALRLYAPHVADT